MRFLDNTILSIIGTIITVVSAIFDFYQYKKNITIEKLRVDDALLLHKPSGRAPGAVQGNNEYSKIIKNIPAETKINKIIYDIGLSEGYCQSLFIETAKIFCNLKKVTIQNIEIVIKNGQLSENYENIYKSFCKRQQMIL